ncbi:hypothetical protein [Halorussus litoreus]|uniref:hypothetical protein n=1 Tax=Halorussus litoreus TaxID=1710536 RepID=UPI0013001C2E|nr:hypothetical protein [Halorussus litoreus]
MHAEKLEKERIASERAEDRDASVASSPSAYNGPLYTYSSGDLDEKTGPINVTWYDGDFTAQNVKQDMLDDGWGSIYVPSFSSYVGYETSNGDVEKSEDKHIKEEAGLVPGEQWHGRLYNIPDDYYGGHEVVGAAHRDPADHGIAPGDEQWRFDDARDKFVDTWEGLGYSSSSESVGNGDDFSSSDGDLEVIY